jgi:hypothetical protein
VSEIIPLNSGAVISHRTVDLGREEEFVTWQEWCARTMTHMREVVPAELHERLAFRVTLADGRSFAVRQVLTHVVKGRCSLQASRWSDAEAICDVVTGYMFMGVGDDELMTTVAVPPVDIASVECVLVGVLADEDDPSSDTVTPFGFHKREGLDVPTEQREIEEKIKSQQN